MNLPLRVLEQKYVFDDQIADCHTCELQGRRSMMCRAKQPGQFNGLMIVGEGPGAMEARLGEPFLGPSGDLMNRLLDMVGVDRSQVWLTNATLCQPNAAERWGPKEAGEKKKKGTKFTDDFPWAVPSCAPRLYTEIEQARPRVILALGDAALSALTGRWVDTEVKSKVECTTCSGACTLPNWKCDVCKAVNLLAPFTTQDTLVHSIPCHECGWIPSPDANVRPQKTKKKCPTCGGRKTRVDVEPRWLCEHSLAFVAGGTFRGEDLGLPDGVRYVIPTYHPSYLLRKTETKGDKARGGQFLAAAALEHFKKAARLLTEDARWNLQKRIVRTVEELDAYLAAKTQYCRWTTVDIETDAKEEFDVTRIKCVGLHHEHHAEAAVVVTEETLPDGSKRALQKNHPLIRRLSEWFADPSQEKTMQNGTYDTQTIWSMWDVEVQGWTRDTKLAHGAIAPDEPHDLSHIAFTYSDAPPWKPPKKKGGIESFQSDEELWHYNATDCVATTVSMQHIERELVKERAEFVHRLDIFKVHVARGMDRAGMPVDLERWNLRRREVAAKEYAALEKMREMIGKPDFNPNSGPQLQAALFDPGGPLRLVPNRFTDTGQPSTDSTALAKHHEHPFVQALLEYKENSKLHGTYFGRIDENGEQTSGIVIKADGRLYCEWKPDGARTGRWSSSPNFQNWPLELRDVILARPRRKLIGADLSQAELRVIAALSGDEAMIAKCMNADEKRKLEPEWDPHSYVASFAFPNYHTLDLNDPAQAKARKALREVAKTVIYAMNYGAGAETIWKGIYDKGYTGPPISVEMVRRVMEAYFKAFPRVREYVERVLREATATGYVRDALIGRFRVFPLGDVDSTIAKNFGIQATVASMMDMSLCELAVALPSVDPTAKIIAQVHDAIYLDVDEACADKCASLLAAAMSQEIQLVEGAAFMSFPATAKIGDRWSEVS